ncbi:hypothetical protein BGZ59_007140 [Podila verticillata]|nr:hypothetical protein BGZ59_007140 [Podila verticillata]
MASLRHSIPKRIQSFTFLLLLIIACLHVTVRAASKGASNSDMPFDDSYPDNKTTIAKNTTEPPYQTTKTWPPVGELTVSSSDNDDNSNKTPAKDYDTDHTFPDREYIRLLDYSFLFYEAQRSGKLPKNQRVTWRNDSAVNDGKDAGYDLSGGYYDAGDYIKFILPYTFTMTQICWGALEFYDGYELANQTQYLDEMVRWGMDWLIKAHPNNNTLYVQIGIDEVDNTYWGPDTGIPTPRPSFFVSNTKPGTDVMADAAAAFAACSALYRDKLHDTTYATTLATHATDLFRLAETALPHQVYQTVVPAASCCYPSAGYNDELAWASAWLFRLTQDVAYSAKAALYTDEINHSSVDTPPTNWDEKSSLVYILMHGLTQGTANATKWSTLARKFAEFTVNPSKPCAFTPGGLYYCYGLSGEDSSVVAANAALAIQIFAAQLSKGSTGSNPAVMAQIERYNNFTQTQIRYLLGNNPEKMPYMVGVHPNSPVNPHSALAAGGRSASTLDTEPENEAHVLKGALVGGPDKNDRFMDQRSNWRQSEVALDYNAPFTGLLAYQVMTAREPPPYVTIPPGRPHVAAQVNGMALGSFIVTVLAYARTSSAMLESEKAVDDSHVTTSSEEHQALDLAHINDSEDQLKSLVVVTSSLPYSSGSGLGHASDSTIDTYSAGASTPGSARPLLYASHASLPSFTEK